MKKYFIGINWIEETTPILHIKDFDNNNDEFINIPNDIDLEFLNRKVCIGTINPYTREYFSCDSIIDGNESQCNKCKYKFDFYKCVRCHGDDCYAKSLDVLKYCDTPHYVYLTYFFGNKIKVGTASEIRKNDRLLEQGAIFSMFIAKTPTGKLSRIIEKEIMNLGITGAVTTSYKMNNIVDPTYSYDEIMFELKKEYQNVIKNIPEEYKQYIINPEIIYHSKIEKNIQTKMLLENEQISLFEMEKFKTAEYSIIKNFNNIKGKYLFAIGKIIALENKGVIYLLDTKKIEGFLFDFKSLNLSDEIVRRNVR